MFDAFVKLTLQRAKGEITPVNPTYIIYSATEWDFYKNCLLASVGKGYNFYMYINQWYIFFYCLVFVLKVITQGREYLLLLTLPRPPK